MAQIKVDVALKSKALLGEGPVWDDSTERLFWVDIPRQEVHQFDPTTNFDDVDTMPAQVGVVAPRKNGGLIIAMEDRIEANDSWKGRRSVLARPTHLPDGARFNDGACDPSGRFWVGTLTENRVKGAASLYRLAPEEGLTEIVDGVTVSNGMGWSPDGRTFYYVDTPTLGVDAFDFDRDSGEISNRRRLITIEPNIGRPDGLCIDEAGGIWVTLIFGGAVHRYSPRGDLDRRVEMPTTKVTSCAFGGSNFDVMYVTSGTSGLSASELISQPNAGNLFCFSPGTSGVVVSPFHG